MNTGPLNENELEWLDDTLAKYAAEGAILDVSELDGLLTAIPIAPVSTIRDQARPRSADATSRQASSPNESKGRGSESGSQSPSIAAALAITRRLPP